VLSYGEVARRAGYPRAARAVGNILASHLGLPWWRVVRADGTMGAHSAGEQARRLKREGVEVRDNRVVRRPTQVAGRSRTTSFAGLSVRRPRKRG
jgi:methylated-DNA-protein-cysteine methyltransferase-like protein